MGPGEEYDLVTRKSSLYSQRAELIWESRSASTTPQDVKEMSQYERLAQEAQVIPVEIEGADSPYAYLMC